MATENKHILVLDIPLDATAKETEDLLNEPYTRGYYFMQFRAVDTAHARAYFKKRAKPTDD
jgi:hypothetical protein